MSQFIKIKCNKCNAVHPIKKNDFQIETYVVDDDREMGEEICIESSLEWNCVECKSPLSIKFETFEYPVGVENWTEVTTEGCEVVK